MHDRVSATERGLMITKPLVHNCNRYTNSEFKITYCSEDKSWKISRYFTETEEDDAIIYFCPFCGIKLPEDISNQDLVFEYQEFIKDILSNHDHDEDAHRYRNRCYVCDAEKLMRRV